MKAVLEFQDSEVRQVEATEQSLTVVFSAALVHGAPGQRGADAGARYLQGVEMVFTAPTWAGTLTECVGRLARGTLWADGATCSRVALPFLSTGPVKGELQFANGALLAVQAQQLACRFLGEPSFFEDYRC